MATKKKEEEILPPPPSSDYVPDIRELDLDRHELQEMVTLITKHGELGFEKRLLEKERDSLTPHIKRFMGQMGLGKLACGEFRSSYYNVPRTSLSVKLLLEEGVSAATIAKCTVTKDSYTLKTLRKDEEEE